MEIRRISARDTLKIRHSVLWPDKPEEFCILPDDEMGHHYGVFIDNILVSTASIFINEKSARLRKFATLKEYQGRGYGSDLIGFIINDLHTNKSIDRFWCDARLSAKDFYTRFCMSTRGEVFYKSDVEYIVMERSIPSP